MRIGQASIFGLLLMARSWTFAAEESFHASEGVRDDLGCLVHDARSSWQSGTTQIRVLVSPSINVSPGNDTKSKYPVVYVLPVEANREHRFGDGLKEIVDRRLHLRYEAIFVAPTFSQLPWYVDHPTQKELRQETYLVDGVVPFIDRKYPAMGSREGRLLVGFSKSGWGAWAMLLRHPEIFQKAAAWDAPLMMNWPSKYGSRDLFATEENFQRYEISRLLTAKADLLQQSPRLIHAGYGNFREEHRGVQQRIEGLKIKVDYRDGPERKHDWHSGWLEEMLAILLAEAKKEK